MMNPPSSLDGRGDALARLESVGRAIADEFGCMHFRFDSLNRIFTMYRLHRETNFPADEWSEPREIDGKVYQKGTMQLPHGYRIELWKSLT